MGVDRRGIHRAGCFEIMRPVIFTAGLGDVIRTCYLTRSLQHLEEAASPVSVLVASHNPFSMELFRFHRNATQFVLYDLGHKYQELLGKLTAREINEEICRFAGVDHASLVRGPADPGYRPTFDAPDNVASSGHIVFQPFAGNNGYRGLPSGLTERIVPVLREQPCPVFLVTRNYLRGTAGPGALHGDEDAHQWAGGNITVLDSLSTPATLNLVKSSRAVVGSFSSLVQAAWFEDKPVATFYPANCRDACGDPPSPYAFGMKRADCLGRTFSEADVNELRTFLARWH
jgi:hypothetical protein